MKTDPFEALLHQQPWRTVPPDWRDEILHRARAHQRIPSSKAISSDNKCSWLRQWLWPHPGVWATLGCCWVIIFTLEHIAAPSAVEMAQARAGTAIAAAARIALLSHPDLLTDAPPAPAPPVHQPSRRPGAQGRIETVDSSAFT